MIRNQFISLCILKGKARMISLSEKSSSRCNYICWELMLIKFEPRLKRKQNEAEAELVQLKQKRRMSRPLKNQLIQKQLFNEHRHFNWKYNHGWSKSRPRTFQKCKNVSLSSWKTHKWVSLIFLCVGFDAMFDYLLHDIHKWHNVLLLLAKLV